MVNRSIATLSRLCAAAALVVLGTTALLQITGASPAAGAGSSVGLFAWGENDSGQLGNGSTTTSTTPVVVELPSGVTPKAIAGSFDVAFAIGSDGNLYAWGSDVSGELGNGTSGAFNSTTPVVVSLPSGVKPMAIAGSNHTGYAIGSDGHLYAWGEDFDGNLGNGTVEESSDSPVQVSLPSGVTATAIAASGQNAYAIGSDGHLYAWGDNTDGQLGNGTDTGPDICISMTPCSTTPVLVSLPSGVTPEAIAGGYAIGSDGHLYAWGYNGGGELGNGTNGGLSTTPVVVLLPSGVTPTAIAAGGADGYAKGSNGHLYAWGDNGFGELGNGTNGGSTDTPVQVSLPLDVTPTAIAGGIDAGYAIGSDGNLYAWGGNGSGDLGNGTTTNSSTPVLVSLPPSSTPLKLASEPGSASGYAIVNAPNVAPTVTTQPVGQAVASTQSATFTAAASGFPTPTMQWQVSTDGGLTFSPLPGATSDTLTIAGTTLAENGNEYEAVFTNGAGSATTNAALLTVTPATAPVITIQPISQTVNQGGTVTFTAAASGAPTPTVQWQVSADGGTTWIDAPGLTSPSISGVPTPFVNGWEFRAVFTNSVGSATTNAATIAVIPAIAPVITTQPISQSVTLGGTVTFTAAASGAPTPTVQWQVSADGGTTWIDAPGLTSPSISGVPTPFVNGWEFRAVFTNDGGSASTNAATLAVT